MKFIINENRKQYVYNTTDYVLFRIGGFEIYGEICIRDENGICISNILTCNLPFFKINMNMVIVTLLITKI